MVKKAVAKSTAKKIVTPAKVLEPVVRSRILQTDVPSMSLDKSLRIAKAIVENYGNSAAATPLQIAAAIEVQPSSGPFRTLMGASVAYELTSGGYNAEVVSVTKLGSRIVRPTAEGDDLAAKREAVLKPRVIREFLQKYAGASMPRPEIARNVLIEMGVPGERADDVFAQILENASSVGFITEISGRKYVELTGNSSLGTSAEGPEEKTDIEPPDRSLPQNSVPVALSSKVEEIADERLRKVFITHGKNHKLIEPIKKLLEFGELQPFVSVQVQTVSQPVPTKVLAEMRACGAAIIHVEEERSLIDNEGIKHAVLNDNVLIEIGAAMALYGDRFIMVVKDGVKLPSNLQGLLELRYKGETLDMEETVKLLGSIQDMKKRGLPKQMLSV